MRSLSVYLKSVRDRLIERGPASLSDQELLAVLLRENDAGPARNLLLYKTGPAEPFGFNRKVGRRCGLREVQIHDCAVEGSILGLRKLQNAGPKSDSTTEVRPVEDTFGIFPATFPAFAC